MVMTITWLPRISSRYGLTKLGNSAQCRNDATKYTEIFSGTETTHSETFVASWLSLFLTTNHTNEIQNPIGKTQTALD
jgi:hypothetical protein